VTWDPPLDSDSPPQLEGIEALLLNIERAVIGKRDVALLLLTAILCDGHVLIEDVPGTGKTLLAKSMAASLDLDFRRLQFTPDMLPSDVTGSSVFNQATAQFEFRPGPVFANVILADEINRATPRTQAALLEAMEERQVSVDGTSMPLPRPFLVAATQNPVEMEGTFPLPEAQLDRFLLRVGMGYPAEAEEAEILTRFAAGDDASKLAAVVSRSQLAQWRAQRAAIRAVDDLRSYVVRLVRATRGHPDLELGASPRAALGLYRASQAWALLSGRRFVIPDDVKRLAVPVLAHRLIPTGQARLHGTTAEAVVEAITSDTEAPVEVA